MGSLFSPNISAPPPPPPLPPAAIPSSMATKQVQTSGANQLEAAKKAAGAGFAGTLKTSPQGDLVPAPSAKAQLLGETTT